MTPVISSQDTGIARKHVGRREVLIIKPGYSETLDPDTSGTVSLGDILRTTVVLHLFPPEEFRVTWLTSPEGVPLLKGNPYIDRILKVNVFTPYHLQTRYFDIVINLEKDPGICAFADKIPAWRRYGFRFVQNLDAIGTYDHGDEALTMVSNPDFKRQQQKSWSEMLYAMLDHTYEGQRTMLGYKPKTKIEHDIGLNHKVGAKFPLKRWPKGRWEKLAKNLQNDGHSVCWQQSANDLEGYMDWIHSCRVLVTNDSLGLHLGIAMGKKIVALFGPTAFSEVGAHGNIVKIRPDVNYDCIPCIEDTCIQKKCCMNFIDEQTVGKAVLDIMAAG